MSGDDVTTNPTIETVLERINSLGEKFDGRMSSLGSEVGEIRKDLRTGLKQVERKIDVLNNSMLQMVADRKDLEERVENLETKAS